jgi:hypothetical protein
MFEWNMEMSDDQSIKGDFSVKARGSSSLVAKELRANQLDQFAAAVANPLDAPYVNRAELLRRRAEAHDIGEEIIKSDKDVKAEQEGQMESPQAMAAMEEMKAKIANMYADAELKEAKEAVERVDALSKQLDAVIKSGGDIETMMQIYQELNSALDPAEKNGGAENHQGVPGQQYQPGMENTYGGQP